MEEEQILLQTTFLIRTKDEKHSRILKYYCDLLNIDYKMTEQREFSPDFVLDIVLQYFQTTREELLAKHICTGKKIQNRERTVIKQYYYCFAYKYVNSQKYTIKNICDVLFQEHAMYYFHRNKIENMFYIEKIKNDYNNIKLIFESYK